MKFLVEMTALDNNNDLAAMVGQIENQVFPSFDLLQGLEKEGRITGGTALGQRRVLFVADVENHAQLDKIIRTLPIWGITKTEVTVLHGFAEHIALDKELIAKMKG